MVLAQISFNANSYMFLWFLLIKQHLIMSLSDISSSILHSINTLLHFKNTVLPFDHP